ncbi:NAD(P)-binding Rossmann-fold superfamily protein [Striga asiatica]|uniref:NAD(P)-binding Rossmann-fold superfamily protein n=1 Tax=Striga asiatica TaxID=4170 RepID=A0A5A7QKY4_STRAF|nr:NAD(P)-binding Rossmann-fold superfamily protein [Striga asiatica]
MENGDEFSIYLNHGGKFTTNNFEMEYDGFGFKMLPKLDVDRFGYLDLEEEVQNLGYKSWGKLYYKMPGVEGPSSMKLVHNDDGIMEMITCVKKGHKVIDVYVDDCVDEENDSEDEAPIDEEILMIPIGNSNRKGEGSSESSEDEDYVPVLESSSDDDDLCDHELASDDEERIKKRGRPKKIVDSSDIASFPKRPKLPVKRNVNSTVQKERAMMSSHKKVHLIQSRNVTSVGASSSERMGRREMGAESGTSSLVECETNIGTQSSAI